MKVLFVKLGALGDVINTLPLAVSLKQQTGAEIHWLVAPLSHPLVANHKAVDKTILFDKTKWFSSLKQVRKNLRQETYDIVFDLQRTLKSGFFTFLANGERKIGFDKARCKEMTWLFPFERIAPSDPLAHMLDQYLEFAAHIGMEVSSPTWQIPVSGTLPPGLPDAYVVLNTGATKPANKWQPESFSKLADLIQETLRLPCVLTGGPEDVPFTEEILLNSTQKPINKVGKTTVGELTEILRKGILTVSCDTGPMHLAVACGKPVVALFGPSNPARTGPYKGRVITGGPPCAPCGKKTCEEPKCMEKITPETVCKAILEALYEFPRQHTT